MGGEEGLAVNGWCGCFTLDEGVYVIYIWRDNICSYWFDMSFVMHSYASMHTCNVHYVCS